MITCNIAEEKVYARAMQGRDDRRLRVVNAVMADVYEVLAVCLLASPVDVMSYILDVHENGENDRHAHNPMNPSAHDVSEQECTPLSYVELNVATSSRT